MGVLPTKSPIIDLVWVLNKVHLLKFSFFFVLTLIHIKIFKKTLNIAKNKKAIAQENFGLSQPLAAWPQISKNEIMLNYHFEFVVFLLNSLLIFYLFILANHTERTGKNWQERSSSNQILIHRHVQAVDFKT